MFIRKFGSLHTFNRLKKLNKNFSSNDWIDLIGMKYAELPDSLSIFRVENTIARNVRVHDGSSSGGKSKASFKMFDSENGDFLRFESSLISNELYEGEKKDVAGLRIDFEESLDLRDYDALEIVMRINRENDMILNAFPPFNNVAWAIQYGMRLIPSDEFKTITIPFKEFVNASIEDENNNQVNEDCLLFDAIAVLIVESSSEDPIIIDIKSIQAIMN